MTGQSITKVLENPTMSNDSCRTALADQVDAANAEQVRWIAEITKLYGMEYREDLEPFALGLLLNLGLRYIAGQTNLCPHLTDQGPQPGHWWPSQPGKIRCGPCFARASRRMKGTRLDHLCDSCGRYAYKALKPSSFSRPGMVVDLAESGMPPLAWPPVSVYFWLCPSCLDGQGQA